MHHDSNNKAGIDSAHIDPELWARFSSVESQEEYCHTWIALQCSIIPNIVQGVLVLGNSESGSFAPVSKWPEEGESPERLAEISERVIEERCGLLVELGAPGENYSSLPPSYGVAYPIMMDGDLRGLLAVEVKAEKEEQLKSTMGQLQWGISWMELLFRRKEARESEALMERLKSGVDILACVLSENSFKSASMSFVTEMSTYFDCDRVSIGFIRKNKVHIQAISHSSQVGERMNLIRSIEMAMDEAIIQRKEINYPRRPDGELLIVRDHEKLEKQHGSGSILTMPFHSEGKYCGTITLERSSANPFTDEEVNFCRSVSSLIFPALESKRQNDRSLILRLWDGVKNQVARLFGPHYLGRKIIAVFVAAVIVFFSVKMGDYRISAATVLEGAVKRVVVAPFEGYVKDAKARAGDTVNKGEPLCIMDDRDLRLERLNWFSKKTQYQRQYQEALAKHNRAEAKIIAAQLEQAKARLNLMESRLKRTVISAPFNGLIISGDLSQRLGGAVEKGEILFEVAPLDAYRVIIEVDERRITDVKAGQGGEMILSALPREKFSFIIDKITPISTAKEGLNYFRVEARPESISERFRPGMEGIGKIYVDRRKLFAIWTRNLSEWLRIWLWSWWP